MLSTWHNNQQVDGGHYEAEAEAEEDSFSRNWDNCREPTPENDVKNKCKRLPPGKWSLKTNIFFLSEYCKLLLVYIVN